jgi:putative ABC transport system substrate-binding protein
VRRREFIIAIPAAAAMWRAARAQQPARRPTVGFMGADAAVWSPWTAAFVKRLGELGWIDNRTVSIAYRWDQGVGDRIADIAAEFVKLKVDVVVTTGGEAAIVKKATSDIPIIFAVAVDPIANGLVKNLAHPDGNATGLSADLADINGKRLELLRQLLPQLRKVGLLFDAGDYAATLEAGDVQAAARRHGIDVATFGMRRAADISSAFAALKPQADALCVAGGAVISANSTRIAALALGARLPTIFNNRDYVRAGGLLSYAPDIPAQFARAAELTDKILRGAKPVDIPVEPPGKFYLAVNIKTANAIGLGIPQSLRAGADEVIE